MSVSRKFYEAIKLTDVPAYKLAHAAGCHPSWLSQAIHGAIKVKPGDPRLVKIGERLGLRADEVFAAEGSV